MERDKRKPDVEAGKDGAPTDDDDDDDDDDKAWLLVEIVSDGCVCTNATCGRAILIEADEAEVTRTGRGRERAA
jgi:hypothetical protein